MAEDASRLRIFSGAVTRHLLLSRHLRLLLLPIIALMIVSNWAELKIWRYAREMINSFNPTGARADFRLAVLRYMACSMTHYTVACLYCTVFRRESYVVHSVMLREFTRGFFGADYDEFNRIGTGSIASIASRQAGAMVRLLDVFVNDLLYTVICFGCNMYRVADALGMRFLGVFLALLAVLVSLIVLGFPFLSRRKMRLNRAADAANNKMIEILNNHTIIRTYDSIGRELDGFSDILQMHVSAGKSYEDYSHLYSLLFRLLFLFSNIVIFILCADQIYFYDVTFSQISEFTDIFGNFKKRTTRIKDICMVFSECYSDIVATELTRSASSALRTEPISDDFQSLLFDSVHILQDGLPIYQIPSLSISPGEKIALTGRNGSGKSSFIKALLGLNRYSGDALINGMQISTINENALHALISYVPQDPHIMDGTVLDNLTYGMESPSYEEAIKTCLLYGVHGTFESLKNGYMTRTGEDGKFLSGGQCQLLSFMRAVLKDAPIFIMDEPTSSLDFTASRELLDRVFTHLASKTVILSTHNPLHLGRFDKILNIRDGAMEVHSDTEWFMAACLSGDLI